MVSFLLPSLKLKDRCGGAETLEDGVHRYLMATFGGYTAAAGNIFGYWRDSDGKESYGEHKRFEAGLRDEKLLPELKRYLAALAARMGEECIYLQTGGEASFVFADPAA
jgi:hypothetical protein